MNIQLPEAATLSRTTAIMHRITADIKGIDGVKDVIGVSGFSILAGDGDNVGLAVAILKPWNQTVKNQASKFGGHSRSGPGPPGRYHRSQRLCLCAAAHYGNRQ